MVSNTERFQIIFLAVGYAPISSSARRPLVAAYVPILLSEVEQEQRHSGNGDHEAIVVGAGLCVGEGERAYTVCDPILGVQKYLKYFKRFAGFFDLFRSEFFRSVFLDLFRGILAKRGRTGVGYFWIEFLCERKARSKMDRRF